MVVLTLTLGFAVTSSLYIKADRNAKAAEDSAVEAEGATREANTHAEAEARERKKAERVSAEYAVEQALDLCEQGDVGRGLVLLAHALTLAPGKKICSKSSASTSRAGSATLPL